MARSTRSNSRRCRFGRGVNIVSEVLRGARRSYSNFATRPGQPVGIAAESPAFGFAGPVADFVHHAAAFEANARCAPEISSPVIRISALGSICLHVNSQNHADNSRT